MAVTNSSDLSTSIFETLRNEILELVIKPGEEISESQVCERFSVTRPPVRTVMRRLSDMGLVEIKPYYGTHATLLNMDKILQVIHMRIILETNVIQDFIASSPSDFVLEELEHNIRLQQIMLNQTSIDRKDFFALDNKLHETWFNQQRCEHIWAIIQEQKIHYSRFRMLDYKTTMKYSEMIGDHQNLVEAIKAKDASKIPVILGQHLNNGIKRMYEKIQTEFGQYVIPATDEKYWQDRISKYY